MMKKLLLLAILAAALGAGFALGVYALPVMIARAAPEASQVDAVSAAAIARGRFERDHPSSDWLHWGDGELWLSTTHVAFSGSMAPGPDYRLFLSPTAIGSAEDFLAHRSSMIEVGDVRGFNGFILALPEGAAATAYTSAIVWCEGFGQFIAATELKAATPTGSSAP